MEDIHREVLIRCRKQLVDDLTIEVAWDHLIQEKVVTTEMKNYIQDRARQHGESATSILLDHLPKRGPTAFDNFCKCILESGHEHLYELMQKTLMEISNEEATHCPLSPGGTENPQAQGNRLTDTVDSYRQRPREQQEIQDVINRPLLCQDTRDELVKHIFMSCTHPCSEIYKMTRNPRGRLLLIINSRYDQARARGVRLKDREASDADRSMMVNMFSKLHFHVEVRDDLSAEELGQALEGEAQSNHSHYDCFACIISAHGVKEGVYGVDGILVNLDDMFPQFGGTRCRSLAGKPKIFLIQSSRGSTCDPGVEVLESPEFLVPVSPAEVVRELKQHNLDYACQVPGLGDVGATEGPTHKHHLETPNRPHAKVPSMADFFVAYATLPGYSAFRNTEGGSWFLRTIAVIFKEFAHTHSLTRMMTKVNGFLSANETSRGFKQACVYWSTLTKELYFFPGMHE